MLTYLNSQDVRVNLNMLFTRESSAALLELIRMLRKQLLLAVLTNYVVAAGALWYFSAVVPHDLLIVWAVGIFTINIARLVILRAIEHADFSDEGIFRIARRYVVATMLLGMCWGSFSFMPLSGEVVYELMVVLMLTGMAGGALTSNAALVQSYYAFIFPILLPQAALWIARGDVTGFIIGFMSMVYGIYLIITAWNLNRAYSESIRNRLDQERLNEELVQAEQALDQELNERIKVQENLQKVKAELEQAVGRLEYLSSIDSLTGIANRRIFDETIAREWSRARREGQPLALLFIDIDYFKRYNDIKMHQAGDVALKAMAGVISGFAKRPADLAARYGGEEFALILGGCDLETAIEIAEKLRKEAEGLGILHPASGCSSVLTLSVGVAVEDAPQTDDYSKLITQADAALYEAKADGRNRVAVARLGQRHIEAVSGTA